MKRFFLKLFVFGILVFIIDITSGIILSYLQNRAIGGDTGRNNYICNKTDENILIFGSSRASHHYISTIIEDSLNMSCYNCGQDGNGIILMYGRYKMIIERYKPNIIIYDIIYDFDLKKGDNQKYISWLKPYYSRNGIDSIFWNVNYSERFKMVSNMYKYNSQFTQIISDNIFPQQSDIKGFRPLYGSMNYEPQNNEIKNSIEYDKLKLYYLEKFIKECKNTTQLIFIISPFYFDLDLSDYQAIIDLCNKYDIPFVSYLNDKDFIGKKDLFKDSSHLNYLGAKYYTKKIINDIRNICHKNIINKE